MNMIITMAFLTAMNMMLTLIAACSGETTGDGELAGPKKDGAMKQSCCGPAKPEFYINFCSPTNEEAMNFYILNAMGGKWPLDQFCQAISSHPASLVVYDLSISLYNFKGCTSQKKDCGHPGVIFNAKDSLNYDFVYFRPHSAPSCYQTGYMVNGEVKMSESSYCPNGPPKGKTWTTIELYVRSGWAYLLMDTRLVTIIKFHYPQLTRGGAVAANGYNNLVFFKGYRVSTPPALPILRPSMIKGCTTGTGWMTSSSLVLNANHGSWPASGFCRVQHHATLPGSVSKYEMTVRLYNIRSNGGVNFGHPGVMYNVQDMNNFDFVYFRPHSASGCYQTGYVRIGAFTMINSSTCPGGLPTGTSGFLVTVKVHSNSNVQIFINNKIVKNVNPYFPVKAKGGVIVANGYGNIIQASSFSLRNL